MVKPTREDAKLLLELVEIFPRDAYLWFENHFAAKDYEEFKKLYPHSGEDYKRILAVVEFYEIAGVLVSHGLLNENLFFDLSFGVDRFWKRFSLIVAGWQKETTPALWENAVWLAHRNEEWTKKVWKPGMKWKLKST